MARKQREIIPEMVALLRGAAHEDPAVALPNRRELAKALTLPLRQALLKGDILGNIYETIDFEPGVAVEFPLDFMGPGQDKDFVAYTIPTMGRLPERHVEGDMVMVPTFDVGNNIEIPVRYIRDARWDVVGRAMQVMENGVMIKSNRDGWRVVLAAGAGRGIVVSDDQATPGLFTKRLIALGQTVMRRNAGGNSTSINRGTLTDVYMSPESHQDVLSWDLTQVPDAIRSQIFVNWQSSGLTKIGPTTLHDLDELGVGQEFQKYYTDTLGGDLPGTGDAEKLEILVGLDLTREDNFVHPVREPFTIYEDNTFHRQRRVSFYGWSEWGWTSLDSRGTLLLAC